MITQTALETQPLKIGANASGPTYAQVRRVETKKVDLRLGAKTYDVQTIRRVASVQLILRQITRPIRKMKNQKRIQLLAIESPYLSRRRITPKGHYRSAPPALIA